MFRRKRSAKDFQAEIEAHLALEADDLLWSYSRVEGAAGGDTLIDVGHGAGSTVAAISATTPATDASSLGIPCADRSASFVVRRASSTASGSESGPMCAEQAG